jgi:heme-degrading monooxygenase HmoA
MKVLIERHMKEGKEPELFELIKELRARAARHRGYLSGDILQGEEDKSLLIVVCNWTSTKEWNDWAKQPERREILAQMEPLLSAPTKITTLTPVR